MADVRHVGEDYGLYVNAGSEPVNPNQTTNYTPLGLEIGHQVSISSEEIQAVDKDTGGAAVNFAGQTSYQITLNGNLSKEGNAGADIIEAAALALTQDGKLIYWLSTPGGSSPNKQRRGSGRVTSHEIVENVNEVATFTATLSGVGVYVKEDVA